MTLIGSLSSIGNNKLNSYRQSSIYNNNIYSTSTATTTTTTTNEGAVADNNFKLWGKIISIFGVMFSNKGC